MIRVLLADDHQVVREGLRRVLETAPDIRIVGEAVDGRAALEALEAHTELDVIVLDLSLPRVSGIEVLRRTLEIAPMVRVLVLSMYPERQYSARLKELGAAGYIGKTRPATEVLQAIRLIAGGGTYFNEGPQQTPVGDAPHDALTPREYQVFMLLIQGRRTSDIAAEMDLTASTVSNHIGAIRTKLDCRTVVDVIRYASREGLIEAPVLAGMEED